MAKYRKKPVVIEAVQWTGKNIDKVLEFTIIKDDAGRIKEKAGIVHDLDGYVKITTLEGVMTANPGDFIIKGVHGEFYPCKPDIFEQTYEKVEA